jgi:hypothetical protein
MKHLICKAIVIVWPILLLLYASILEGRNSVFTRGGALKIEIVLFVVSSISVFAFAALVQSRSYAIGYGLVVIVLYLVGVKSIEKRVVSRITMSEVSDQSSWGSMQGHSRFEREWMRPKCWDVENRTEYRSSTE